MGKSSHADPGPSHAGSHVLRDSGREDLRQIARLLGKALLYKQMVESMMLCLCRYVGIGEKMLTQVFGHARLGAPTILLFDDLDMLFETREQDSAQAHASSLMTTMLTELDGLEVSTGVCATAPTSLHVAAVQRGLRVNTGLHCVARQSQPFEDLAITWRTLRTMQC